MHDMTAVGLRIRILLLCNLNQMRSRVFASCSITNQIEPGNDIRAGCDVVVVVAYSVKKVSVSGSLSRQCHDCA